ncbi:hypothetical protein EO92_14425 [Methanosarcina sp. 2.H.A.1B.4]|nr:hypothetical protein EO92_14425 [Methanosarcina sp. 2.H.A.1B.4]
MFSYLCSELLFLLYSMLLIFILVNTKIINFVFFTGRDDILFLCHSNPEAILDNLKSLEIELNYVKIELSEIKEKVRDLKALFNPNSQYSNKLSFTDTC